MFAVHLLEGRVDILAYEITILQPAFFAGGVAHALPAFAALHDDHAIAITHASRFGIDGSHTVAEKRLRRGDIQDILLLRHPAYATCGERDQQTADGKQQAPP